jgi:hypothetical protein
MGSLEQWLLVVLSSFFWAGWMSVLEGRRRKAAKLEPMQFRTIILRWILPGLTFGFLFEFRWRAFHFPLVFVTVGIFVLDFATARVMRETPFEVFVQPVPMKVTWKKVISFFLLMVGFVSLLVPKAVPQEIAEIFVVAGGVILMFDYFHLRRRKPS